MSLKCTDGVKYKINDVGDFILLMTYLHIKSRIVTTFKWVLFLFFIWCLMKQQNILS